MYTHIHVLIYKMSVTAVGSALKLTASEILACDYQPPLSITAAQIQYSGHMALKLSIDRNLLKLKLQKVVSNIYSMRRRLIE